MAQPEAKCSACQRVAVTHAPGCSAIPCPHRRAQVWNTPEGPQGFPGSHAEDRFRLRRDEFHRAVGVDIADL